MCGKTLLNAIVALLVWGCSSGYAFADVYGKAYYWGRGIAADSDADGILDNISEVHDSLSQHTAVAGGVCNPCGSYMSFTNELVWMPYRGVKRVRPCIYFPQSTVVTNASNGYGYGLANAIHFSSSFAAPFSAGTQDDKKDFAVAMRFRPDFDRPMSISWLLNFGYTPDKTKGNFGFLLGFTGVKTNAYTLGGVAFTNYTANITVAFPNGNWEPGAKVIFGAWNDIVFSVKGKNLSMLVSRTQPLDRTAAQNSYSADMETVFLYTNNFDIVCNPTPYTGGKVIFGGETADTDTQKRQWNALDEKKCNFAMKRFKGSLQSLAIWTNALTEMEMREAAAWPRTDLWRVGTENSGTGEFAENASGEIDVDADRWNAPKGISSGDSVTFAFPLNATGEAEMNQLFTVKTVEGSGPYSAGVAVNGVQLSLPPIKTGNATRWFVPGSLLSAGATNRLTFTRTDAGSSALEVDSFSFGGSLQYGEHDNNYEEFSKEGRSQSSVFHLIGGNWYDGLRAFFCVGNTAYNGQTVAFNVPDDLCRRYGWKMKFYTRYNSSFTGEISINGVKICDFSPNTPYQVDIPKGVLQAENVLEWVNITPHVTGATYMSPDYFQLILQKPSFGTVVTLR